MASAGDVLENPVTRQRLVFRNTTRDSGCSPGYEEEFRLVKPPWLIQRVLFGVLRPPDFSDTEVLIPGTTLRSRRLFRGGRLRRMSPSS
jgi:hypothetical protein